MNFPSIFEFYSKEWDLYEGIMVVYYGGIDPSSREDKPTGCCVLNTNAQFVKARHVGSDQEMVEFFAEFAIAAIGIDAPCSLPAGMGICCLEHPANCCCERTPSRQCERLMRKLGFPLYPVSKTTFPSAKAWIKRGLGLYACFREMRIPCFEIYPYAAKKRLFPGVTFPERKSSPASRCLLQFGLQNRIGQLPHCSDKNDELLSDHILDALLGALSVLLYQERSEGELIGDPQEGQILIPMDKSVNF